MFNKAALSFLGVAALCALPLRAQTAAPHKRDGDFLKVAAEADMTTTHLGKMAEDKASASEVKDFGRKLVLDHTSDYQQLSELAVKTGQTVPKAIDKEDNRRIASIEKYEGKAFDRAFVTAQVAEHEKLVKAFKDEAAHGDNSDIKAYANKTLPTIEGHLHDVQDLLKTKSHKG